MTTMDDSVYRHSLFQSTQLCSLYDLTHDRVLEPLCKTAESVKSVGAIDEDRCYYKDAIELFDFFEIDENACFNLLSNGPDSRQRAFLKCTKRRGNQRQPTWRLAVKREIARSEHFLQPAYLDIDLVEVRRRIEQTGASHVVVGVDYSLFDVLILDSGRLDLTYDGAKYLLDKEFKTIGKKFEESSSLMSLRDLSLESNHLISVNMSYYNNVNHQFHSRINLDTLRSLKDAFVNRLPVRSDFFKTLANTSVRLKLMHVHQFLQRYCNNYSPSSKQQQLNAPPFGLNNAEFAQLVYELYWRRAKIKRLASEPLYVPKPERLYKATFASKLAELQHAAAFALSTVERCIEEGKQAVTKYQKTGDVRTIERAIGEYSRTLQNLIYPTNRLAHVASELAAQSFDWNEKMRLFKDNGVVWLESRSQLAGSATTVYVFVFNPLVSFAEMHVKWRSFLLLIENESSKGFFCTIDLFEREITGYVNSRRNEHVFIHKFDCKQTPQAFKLSYRTRTSASHYDELWKKGFKEQDQEKPKTQINKNKSESTSLDDINILLLGETGVGKSTFINAYYNYLTFSSLEEAMKEPKLHGLVCSTFSFTDSQLNVKKVTVSKNIAPRKDSLVNVMEDGVNCEANEVFKRGETSTQHAKAYEFKHKGRLIRLIDTPGIGDSRGIEVDQANFKQTIEYLARLDHLNAVCIMLKAEVLVENQTSYCIKEIFSHLNKVSICNVVFCFTHSSGTRLTLGDTLNSLRRFIAKEIEAVSNVKVSVGPNNIVCMDNEAFRYLVLAKNVKSEEERACFNELGHQKTFAESWQISKEASEKLVEYTETLPVLKMSEMVAYNQSRTMSLKLVDEVIAVLVRLAQSRADLGIGHDKESHSRGILDLTAAITRFFSAHSLTTFNDQFEVRFEKTIRTCKTSLNERESRIIPSLEAFRADYKAALQAGNDGELTADLNVDAKIFKLIFLILEIRTHKTNHKR